MYVEEQLLAACWCIRACPPALLTLLPVVCDCRRLAENKLQGDGLQYLAEGLPSLVDLDLRSNQISNLPDEHLFARRWERLDLRHNQLKYERMEDWVRSLLTCPILSCVHQVTKSHVPVHKPLAPHKHLSLLPACQSADCALPRS